MSQTTQRPIDRHPASGLYLLVDVDREGRTAEGETFTARATDREFIAGTASETRIILRHPCGRLEMAIRVRR